MEMQERDNLLDFLKLVGCLLMVLSHSHTPATGWLTHNAVFLGTFAPVVFFGVSGVTSAFQSRTRPLGSLLLYYALFFLLGLSFCGVKGINFWQQPRCEILEGIALGTGVTLLLLRRIGREKAGFLFPLPFLIYIAVKESVDSIPVVAGFIFPPGLFPLFPWLSFFLFGLLCHYHRRLGFGLAFGAALAYAFLCARGMGHCVKWEMNVAFFLVGVSLYGFLYAARFVVRLLPGWAVRVGRYSLLFFYVHFLVLYLWRAAGLPSLPALNWSVVFGVSVGLCLFLDRINRSIVACRLSNPPQAVVFWTALSIAVLLLPLMVKAQYLPWVSYGCGFLFALNYRALSDLVFKLAPGWPKPAVSKAEGNLGAHNVT